MHALFHTINKLGKKKRGEKNVSLFWLCTYLFLLGASSDILISSLELLPRFVHQRMMGDPAHHTENPALTTGTTAHLAGHVYYVACLGKYTSG